MTSVEPLPDALLQMGKIAFYLSSGRKFLRCYKCVLGGMNINCLVEASRGKKGSRFTPAYSLRSEEKGKRKIKVVNEQKELNCRRKLFAL